MNKPSVNQALYASIGFLIITSSAISAYSTYIGKYQHAILFLVGAVFMSQAAVLHTLQNIRKAQEQEAEQKQEEEQTE